MTSRATSPCRASLLGGSPRSPCSPSRRCRPRRALQCRSLRPRRSRHYCWRCAPSPRSRRLWPSRAALRAWRSDSARCWRPCSRTCSWPWMRALTASCWRPRPERCAWHLSWCCRRLIGPAGLRRPASTASAMGLASKSAGASSLQKRGGGQSSRLSCRSSARPRLPVAGPRRGSSGAFGAPRHGAGVRQGPGQLLQGRSAAPRWPEPAQATQRGHGGGDPATLLHGSAWPGA